MVSNHSREAGIEKFFAVANERYQIFLDRQAGKPKPWSQHPIFQTEYFCNVFRENDRTTTWFRENVRDKVRYHPEKALLAITAFRWFNKIETGELIKDILLDEWDETKVYNRLSCQKPVVTGAYIIKTPDGMTKLKGVLWSIEQFIKNMDKGMFNKILVGDATMEEACGILKQSPYLGNFMSWQICSDARFTTLLENAPDKDTWACPGPGSARGLGRVFYGDVNKFDYGSKGDAAEMLKLMNELAQMSHDPAWWPAKWPKLAVVDVSHQNCEFDKFERCEEGGRMKRKYNAL